jgi:O-antigen/teichoic acid export membrane protein
VKVESVVRGKSVDGAKSVGPVPPLTRGASAAALGIATTVGHALSYAFSLVLSRALGPADFGALGALLGIAVVASVPATALQTQVARLTAVDPASGGVRQGYRLGWLIGGALALGLAALAVPLTAVLRLDSPVSVLLLGAGLIPVIALGARQGVLLGRGAFFVLAATVVLVPALRLAGAGVAAGTEMGVSGALGMQAAASWVGIAAVVGLVRMLPGVDAPTPQRSPGLTAGRMLAAGSGLLGLFVLANADVFLARVLLTDAESGVYAVGSLGAKVVFWGSQFVALLVFPRVARGQGGRRLVMRTGALVAAVGGATAVAAVPLAAPVLDLLVGPAYADAAPVAPWFVVLGTMLALVQLSTYAAVAADRYRFSLLLWGTLALQVTVIATMAHDDIEQIVAVCIVGTGLLAASGMVMARGARA